MDEKIFLIDMIRFIKYFFLYLFSLLWFLGCSADCAKWLYQNGLSKDEYRYGDLYRLSNLSQFREPVSRCKTDSQYTILPINLVLLGDSFTEEGRIGKADFVAENFTRFHLADSSFYEISKEKKNILLIETVERHFRERFLKPYQNLSTQNNQPKKQENKETIFKLPYNTERHQAILFSSDFFLKIKELKAWFNWKILGRIDAQVALSKDEKNILYGLDVKQGIHSCFNEISEEEIELLVKNVNKTQDFYKKAGFDAVILSIIPNKTSIVSPDLGEYNHLIERIQNHPNLKIPFVDTYSIYKKSDKMLYDKGDSHWNCEGKTHWATAVNIQLKM